MSTRCRLRELEAALLPALESLTLAPEQLDCDIDQLEVDYGGGGRTEQGIHFCNYKYTGVIYAERIAQRKLSRLLCLIHAWLTDYDDVRDKYKQGNPVSTVIVLDGAYIDVMIQIPFIDEVYLRALADDESDPNEFIWHGKRFVPEEWLPDYADGGDVAGAPITEG